MKNRKALTQTWTFKESKEIYSAVDLIRGILLNWLNRGPEKRSIKATLTIEAESLDRSKASAKTILFNMPKGLEDK